MVCFESAGPRHTVCYVEAQPGQRSAGAGEGRGGGGATAHCTQLAMFTHDDTRACWFCHTWLFLYIIGLAFYKKYEYLSFSLYNL